MRLELDISGLRGQGYDGGTNMAGKINGLQQKMLKENPKALYFHCIGHQLNMVCQDACTEYSQVLDTITCVNKIVTFVKRVAKTLWVVCCHSSFVCRINYSEFATVVQHALDSTKRLH